MEEILDLLLLREPTFRWVVIGTLLFSISAGIIGSFAFLKKSTLVGDAVSHSVLPGICIAFILFETKNLAVLLTGAFISGWLSLIAIDAIVRTTKLKSDAAIGIVLSVFFGFGLMLLTSIQKTGLGSQAGLNHFIFGSAASIVKQDIFLFAILSALILSISLLLFKPFKLLAFDPAFAKASGLPVKSLEILLSTLTVLAVVQGIQAVGAVLMAAMLITPAAAARYWTNRLEGLLPLSVFFGMLSAIGGAICSYLFGLPTGPVIIVIASFFAIGSILIAPKRGLLARFLLQQGNRRQILDENLLKTFMHLGEKLHDEKAARYLNELCNRLRISKKQALNGLNRLQRKNWIIKRQDTYALSEAGLIEASRVLRLHRLWELYLTRYLRIAEDHVHDDAEAIEHVITPEIEARLMALLDHPDTDPHGKQIPNPLSS